MPGIVPSRAMLPSGTTARAPYGQQQVSNRMCVQYFKCIVAVQIGEKWEN